jgi:hypothetical protein
MANANRGVIRVTAVVIGIVAAVSEDAIAVPRAGAMNEATVMIGLGRSRVATSHVVISRAVMNHVATSLRAQTSHARRYRERRALKPHRVVSRWRRAKEPFALKAIGPAAVARVVADVAGAVVAVVAVVAAVAPVGMAIANTARAAVRWNSPDRPTLRRSTLTSMQKASIAGAQAQRLSMAVRLQRRQPKSLM